MRLRLRRLSGATGATGLLGGSFNPAHRGHRAIALHACKALALDEVWWLVAPHNPLKDAADIAPLSARVLAARRVAQRSRIRVTAIEAELHTRYTIDSLRAIVHRYPKRRFVWLMGADNLAQFHRWSNWRAIAHTMPIAILARPNCHKVLSRAPAMRWLRYFMSPNRRGVEHGAVGKARAQGQRGRRLPKVCFLQIPLDKHTSTELRNANPNWYRDYTTVTNHRSGLRDSVTCTLLTQQSDLLNK